MLIVIHINNTNFCFFLPGVILSWHHVAADLNKRTQLLDNNGRERVCIQECLSSWKETELKQILQHPTKHTIWSRHTQQPCMYQGKIQIYTTPVSSWPTKGPRCVIQRCAARDVTNEWIAVSIEDVCSESSGIRTPFDPPFADYLALCAFVWERSAEERGMFVNPPSFSS